MRAACAHKIGRVDLSLRAGEGWGMVRTGRLRKEACAVISKRSALRAHGIGRVGLSLRAEEGGGMGRVGGLLKKQSDTCKKWG